MTVESVTYITDLDDTYPAGSDDPSEGDNHIRNIKTGITGTFGSFTGTAVTATEAELNILDGATVTTAELNILDGVTSTATELNLLDGLTSVAGLGSNTFTGTQYVSAAVARIDLDETDGTADEQRWSIVANGDTFQLQTRQDDETFGESFFVVGRTGTGVTTANFATGTLQYGGVEVVTLSNTKTLTNKTLTSPVINTGVSGTAILDEDNMASNSATQLATQQSIKAYVDSNVATQSKAIKAAQEFVTTDVTLSDDDTLVLSSPDASSYYEFEIHAIVASDNASNGGMDYTVLCDGTGAWMAATATFTGDGSVTAVNSEGAETAIALSTTDQNLIIKGVMYTGTTPTKIAFQWAQTSSSAAATIVQAHSWALFSKR